MGTHIYIYIYIHTFVNRDGVRNTVSISCMISVPGQHEYDVMVAPLHRIRVVFDGEMGMFAVAVLPITTTQTSVSLCMSILQEHKPPILTHNYLFREVWPMITKALEKRGIGCELDLVEGSMTVKTTRKTDDPYTIIKAR